MRNRKILMAVVVIAIATGLLVLWNIPLTPAQQDMAYFNLRVVHPRTLPYWRWSEFDERYLRERPLSRDTLLREMYALHGHSRQMLEQVQVINNFTFFPSYVTATVHALDRAKYARLTLLRDGALDQYPPLGSLGLLDFVPPIAHTDSRILRDKRKSDRIIADALKSLPFDTSAFRGTRIIKVPFHLEYIGFAERGLATGWIAGFVKGGYSPQIVIGTRSGLTKGVLYHEIGHIWDFIYLDTYAEYLAIRKQEHFIPTKQWTHRLEENFAEDFSVVMGDKVGEFFPHNGIFGRPTSAETAELSAWMQKMMSEGRPHRTHLLVNGHASLGNIIVTKDPYLRFQGAVSGEHYVTVFDPEFAVRSFPLAHNEAADLTIPLDLFGFFTIATPNGEITVVRLDDSYSFPTTANAYGKATSTLLDRDTLSWISFLQGSRGIWLHPADDALYVLINDGAYKTRGTGGSWTGRKIDLAHIEYQDDRTFIHLVEGDNPFLVLRLPLDRNAKPIELVRGSKR